MSDLLLSLLANVDFTPYQRLWVAYSGGVDSTVLLHALSQRPELKSKISVIHVNHNIQKEAAQWQAHCQLFCDQLSLPLIIKSIELDTLKDPSNLEERARNARYQAFEAIINPEDPLLLGHHQEDQAETVLLRLFRGAGVEGLSAMKEKSLRNNLTLLRPLLSIDKKNIMAYAIDNKLPWSDDPSNSNKHFNRNFIRHELLPLIQKRYPGVSKNLSRSAALCFEAQTFLNKSAQLNYEQCVIEKNIIDLTLLLTLSNQEQCLILRQWLNTLGHKMPSKDKLQNFMDNINEAKSDKHPLLCLGNMKIQQHKKKLHAYPNVQSPTDNFTWKYPYLPYEVKLLSRQLCLEKNETTPNFFLPENADLEIRFRQGGEKILLNGLHQKVKKQLQEKNIPFWERDHLPFIYINNELAAISTHLISDKFNQKEKNNHYLYISKL